MPSAGMPLFGNRKKKKDSRSVPDLPKVDLALTVACNGIFVVDVVFFSREEGIDVVLELGVFVLATTIAIIACKFVGPLLGRAFSTKASLEKSRNLRKFSDQSWQLFVHSLMAAYELKLLSDNQWEWWNDTRTLWNTPWQLNGQGCPSDLRRLYLMQLAIWYVTALSHKFIEAKHNDYFVMYGHHAATLGLVSLSYFNHWQPVGLLTLFVHDSSDIIVDVLKMVNYLGLDSSSGLFFAEILFAINLFTWAAARMYFFTVKVIRSTIAVDFFAPRWGDYPYTNHAIVSPQNACRVLLVILEFMHVYWYLLFIKILVKLVKGSDGHDAGREYEGSSDSEREDDAENEKSTSTKKSR